MDFLVKDRKRDWPSIVVMVFLFGMLLFSQFIFKAANRASSDREGMTAFESLGVWFYVLLGLSIVLLLFVLLKDKIPKLNYVTALWGGLCLAMSILAVGQAAETIDLTNPSGRVSMSIGSYMYVLLAYLVIAQCSSRETNVIKRVTIAALPIVIIAVILATGQASHISIMKEYDSNYDNFWVYFSNHLSMSFQVVLCGVVFGVPLGWIAFKRKKAGKVIVGILDTIESIPSLALICLMMFPLSSLASAIPALKAAGVSGVGAAPVFCALFCYSLFQIVNSTFGALKVIDKKYIDVAKGMGMTPAQIFKKVEFPMILPVVLSGIRISLIATILGVTIGSYIGYGGLGMFILLGISGFKLDIIMLGTIPTIMLVLAFDFAFKKLAEFIEYRNRKRGEVKL